MKLLSLKIGDLGKDSEGNEITFRSLHSRFTIKFHDVSNKVHSPLQRFEPFCFAGLNGSGKSNVLEALASIFYHLEMCVCKYRPDSFEKHFRRDTCTPDAFEIKYLISSGNEKLHSLSTLNLVTVTKEIGKEPMMWIESGPFMNEAKRTPKKVSLVPSDRSKESAPGKEYLPDLLVAYSSGENEILSLPFIKTRLIHFDEYREAVKKGLPFSEPETSLIYIDEEMSQAVLLACMLFEDHDTTLKPLREELGVISIRSFRMNLNMQGLALDEEQTEFVPILQHMNSAIKSLKKCASSWHESKPEKNEFNKHLYSVLTLDFFVDENTKRAFRNHFSSSLELFRFFQLLYELNNNIVSTQTKEEVYKSKGFYTDGKLPEAAPEDRVFYFLDYLIVKSIDNSSETKELLLREFSDGEHQFLHTMGICLMLKNRRTLLLLDEPETHFNPSWRAKFIKILDDSLRAGSSDDIKLSNFQLLKDILLTSHSPFIISDCMPQNVLFFKRNAETNHVEAKSASELGIQTYGSSVDYILKNFFKTNLISNKSFEELKDIIDNGTIDELRKAVENFGESSEKQFLFRKIYEKMEHKK